LYVVKLANHISHPNI